MRGRTVSRRAVRGEVRWETKLTCGQTSDILRHQDKCRRGSDMMAAEANMWPDFDKSA